MVYNPVIAMGYPIPKRDQELRTAGLEVSLSLMVSLSRADWATTFGDTLLLKGIISALVATKDTGDAILWHLLINYGKLKVMIISNEDQATFPVPPLPCTNIHKTNDQ